MSSFVQFTVHVEGEVVVDRVLRGIEARASDLRPAWAHVVRAFQGIVRRAFDSEGRSTGTPWPQLKPRTQAERVRQGFPAAHPILQRTRKLYGALTEGTGAHVSGGPQQLAYLLSAEVGYYHYHQSRRPRRVLPRRAMVLLTADDRTELMHPVRLHVTGRDLSAPRRAAIR